MQLDIATVQEFQLRKEVYYRPTSDPFWKKVGSCKPEYKQVMGGLVVISGITDEYGVEFFDE